MLGWRLQRRFAVARALEQEAEALLEGFGFVVESVQPTRTVTVYVDGEPAEFLVRGDYLVRRGNTRFLAEVKSGDRAPDLGNIATRRQLLEYHHAFSVDGILLIDAERKQISAIEFSARADRSPQRFRALLFAFLRGALVAALGTVYGIGFPQ